MGTKVQFLGNPLVFAPICAVQQRSISDNSLFERGTGDNELDICFSVVI